MVVPEVNRRTSATTRHHSNPNCCAIPSDCHPAPLKKAAGIRARARVHISSASGGRRALVDELEAEAKAIAEAPNHRGRVPYSCLQRGAGVAPEPEAQTRRVKIVNAQDPAHAELRITATASGCRCRWLWESVVHQTTEHITADEAAECSAAAGIVVEMTRTPSSIRRRTGSAQSRGVCWPHSKRTPDQERLALWIVSDNLRKGRAERGPDREQAIEMG